MWTWYILSPEINVCCLETGHLNSSLNDFVSSIDPLDGSSRSINLNFNVSVLEPGLEWCLDKCTFMETHGCDIVDDGFYGYTLRVQTMYRGQSYRTPGPTSRRVITR